MLPETKIDHRRHQIPELVFKQKSKGSLINQYKDKQQIYLARINKKLDQRDQSGERNYTK